MRFSFAQKNPIVVSSLARLRHTNTASMNVG
jgi:hypothetical protein